MLGMGMDGWLFQKVRRLVLGAGHDADTDQYEDYLPESGMRALAQAQAVTTNDALRCCCQHQVMVTKEVAEACGTALNKLTATGTSVLVEGELAATPEGVKQVWTGGRTGTGERDAG